MTVSIWNVLSLCPYLFARDRRHDLDPCAARQGLTLVHILAHLNHVGDTMGVSPTVSVTKTAQVELKSGRA